MQSAGPAVDPLAADLPRHRERRVRAERCRYGLPPFVTPLDGELRRIWNRNPRDVVGRLALEMLTGRYALSELKAMAGEAYWHLQKEYAMVDDARKSLGRIRRRLMQELERIGPIRWERR